MPLTKIKRGGLDTGITDNSDANALTFDSSENATFVGSTTIDGVAKISEAGSGNVLLETTQSSKYLQLKSNEGIYFSTSGANHNYIDSSNNLHTQDIHSKDIYLDQPRSNWRTIQYRDTDNSNAIQAYVSAYNTSASDGFLRLNAIESLQFRTGDTERLKLTSSEATFAGTIKSQPAEGTDATLHLDASGNGNAQVWIDAGNSTRHPELSFRHDGSNYWTVKSDPDRSNDFCLRDDQNSATIQLRIAQSTGDATFAGNIVAQNVINFPDTQAASGDANTLDDYEEGVHAVTLGGASFTMSSVKNSLQYTKIGRLVTLSGEISVTAVSSATGTFTISLPFTVADTDDLAERFQGTFSCQNIDFSGDYLNIGSYAAQDQMTVQITNDNGSWTYLHGNTFSSTSEFVVSVQYIT